MHVTDYVSLHIPAASAPLPINHPASVLPLNSKEPLKSTQTWETAIPLGFIVLETLTSILVRGRFKAQTRVKKLKIPLIFINPSTNLSPSKRDKKQDQGIKLELQLNKALEEIAQSNIQAGEQQKQQLIRRQEKLDQQECKMRRNVDLINVQPNLTRSTPGFGLRSHLRSLASKPNYIVDSNLQDKKWECGLREYEKAYTLHNFNKDGQPGKQKFLGEIQCSQTSSEDAEDQISKHSELADKEEEGE
ncbi:hypothetical protein O181_091104 [Austropuccinia psidii MF-1]|uniref:Uncharacterized protein n=1 Tax=Austropuccinia psidii MF-1 TaxID=1389203 RepID=A0A9Q3P7K2_9BASI|nr:hypothetical protein [Austropuccinia psidii MF-1]